MKPHLIHCQHAFSVNPFFLCYSALKYDDLSLSQADEAKTDNGTAKGMVCVHLKVTYSLRFAIE